MKLLHSRALALLSLVCLCLICSACKNRATSATEKSYDEFKKVVVVGVDGLDPKLVSQYILDGSLPNIQKIIEAGGDFKTLDTSNPPQSPVAWSSVAIGANPGKHSLFDFVHRDPKTLALSFSASQTEQSPWVISLGDHQLPLIEGKTKNMRQGSAFWEHLCSAGIESTICKMPANYPPSISCHDRAILKVLSGMATPDLRGTQGTSTFYSTKDMPNINTAQGGVDIVKLDTAGRSFLIGPRNPFVSPKRYRQLQGKEKWEEGHLNVSFTISASGNSATLQIGDSKIALELGHFSDWVEIDFPLLYGIQRINGIVRFYLKETQPDLQLYASPINIAPANPVSPISFPKSYAKELHEHLGNYYTQNMPPDTKALSHGLLTDEEFITQAEIVFKEEEKRLLFEAGRFKKGLLFSYFGTIDQVSHVMWRAIDPKHPLYTKELEREHGNTIKNFYQKLDLTLGELTKIIGNDITLMIISDHGFTSFRRSVNLNSLLRKAGLLSLKSVGSLSSSAGLKDVDWANTTAYSLGMNAVYLNMLGRERDGIVSYGDRMATLKKVKQALLQARDPKTGDAPIANVWTREEVYSGPFVSSAPDLVIGFADSYRVSWESILGAISKDIIQINTGKWSGDHSIAPELVPGVVISNKKISRGKPHLEDIAPTVLREFAIPVPQEMDGRPLFE